MLCISHPSNIVQKIFSYVEKFDTDGQYPELNETEALEILDCVLDLGIDSLFQHIVPFVAQNLKNIPEFVLKKVPFYMISYLIDHVPLARLDPDLIIKYFGYEVLADKVQLIYQNTNLLNPFLDLYNYEEQNPIAKLANNLIKVSHNYAQSPFVINNCTVIESKNYDFYVNFPNLKVLYLHSIDVGDTIEPFLNPHVIKLSIVKCKLKPIHVEQLIRFLPNSSAVYISLRDNRIGNKGCQILSEYIKNNQLNSLKYLDIGLNSIGGTGIKELIECSLQSNLTGIAFDGNFFAPCANELAHVPLIKSSFVSIRALHWDDATVSNIRMALQEPNTSWWDLSAQVIHKNSDPDLSGPMAEQLFKKVSDNVNHLYFANHHLKKMNMQCFMDMNLKTLVLANSGLEFPQLQKVENIVKKLEYFDVSYNQMTFTSPSFLIACAESKTLKFLSLTNNEVSDSIGEIFLINLSQSQSKITTLRLSECKLAKRSTCALITLLSTGNMSFDELDVSVNQMFHNTKEEVLSSGKTRVTKLMLSDNLSDNKSKPLIELLKSVKGLRYLDLDYINFGLIRELSQYVSDLYTLRTSYTKIQDIKAVVKVLKKTKARVLYAQNAFNIKTFSLLMQSWSEVPMLLEIHVESRLKENATKQIHIVYEDLK